MPLAAECGFSRRTYFLFDIAAARRMRAAVRRRVLYFADGMPRLSLF